MSRPVVHLARITVEACSPLSIGAGSGLSHDVALARDANGLPMIPGSSLRGVLRHLWEVVFPDIDDLKLTEWFGVEGGPSHKDGLAGRIHFGFGCVHDSQGTGVQGLMTEAPDFECPLLRRLAAGAPLVRDHVALSHRHTIEGSQKFDRTAVPAGTRFSIELSARSGTGEANQEQVRAVLGRIAFLMEHDLFRLGGASGRGYGRVRVHQATWQSFEAVDTAGAKVLRDARKDPPSRKLNRNLGSEAGDQSKSTGIACAETFTREAVGFMRVGSTGAPDVKAKSDNFETRWSDKSTDEQPDDLSDRDVDLVQVREPRLIWNEDDTLNTSNGSDVFDARLEYVIPGSAIRGAITHRALFHYNRLSQCWASKDKLDAYSQRRGALAELFGWAKDKEAGTGAASLFLIDDAVIKNAQPVRLDHNSIDRFTGGVRNRALFSEEVLYGGEFEVRWFLRSWQSKKPDKAQCDDRECAREALNLALEDLKSGRIALGAKSLGFVKLKEPA